MKLVTAWGACRKKGEHIAGHRHYFYELVYYCKGRGSSSVGPHSFKIAADTFIVIPPDTEHEEFHREDGELFCVGFLCREELPFGMFQDTRRSVYRVIGDIVREISEQESEYEEMVRVKLSELILEIRRLADRPAKPSTKNFEYVINYIEQNYHERILMKNLAEQMHLSYDYFQHRFKEIQGESPQQFLIRRRIEAAEKMLTERKFSCTEIAALCGFSNSAQFSSLFRQKNGVTPCQYKKGVRRA